MIDVDHGHMFVAMHKLDAPTCMRNVAATASIHYGHGHGNNTDGTNANATIFLFERVRYFCDNPTYLTAKSTKEQVRHSR